METIQEKDGVQLTHVPYRGSNEAVTAVIGGQVDMVCDSSTWAPFVEAGQMRALSVWTAERVARFPNVPTLKDLGFPVEMASERGLVAPAGTPPAVLQRLREATEDIAKDPEFIRILESRFTAPAFEGGDAWFARLRGQEATYRQLWATTPWSQK